MSAPSLLVEKLTVGYADRLAVRSVSLVARPGEVLALSGPNGSGKSTLLRAIDGIEPIGSGQVTVLGSPLSDLPLARRALSVAWMPQEEPRGENLLVREYVEYGRRPHLGPFRPPGPDDRKAAELALEISGTRELSERRVWELSGGERQRARLARVLAQSTPILLLDEPTAHLDMGHQLAVLESIRTFARNDGRTVVIALHDLNLAARYADRVVVLSRGRAVADGPPDQVLSPGLLADVWRIDAELRRDPVSRIPYLLPRLLPPPDRSTAARIGLGRRIHVVTEGGSGGSVLAALADEGFEVTVGPVNLFDSDQEAAEALHQATLVELPFAPIGPETIDRYRRLLDECDAVIVTAFPVGPTNLAALETLQGLPSKPPIFLLAQRTDRPWDFTGGTAAEVRRQLVLQGATEVPSLAVLLPILSTPPRRS